MLKVLQKLKEVKFKERTPLLLGISLVLLFLLATYLGPFKGLDKLGLISSKKDREQSSLAAGSPTNIGSVVEPGSMVTEANYIIFVDGTNYYAKDGKTGEIKFSGSGDATPVIRSAIDALPATGGKIVLTEGTFTLSKTIVLGSTGTTIEGQGYATFIQFNGDTIVGEAAIGHKDGAISRTVTGATVKNLRVKNTGVTKNVHAVWIGDNTYVPQNITIDHVEAENCSLMILGGSHHRIEHSYVHDITVTAIERAIAIGGHLGVWASDSIIANNIIENVPNVGILPAQIDGLVIANNRLKKCSQITPSFAIDVSNSINVLITGNSIESKDGILSENADAGTVQITDNTIKGTGLTGGAGIQVWRHTDTGPTGPQADRILISSNTVHNAHFGIYVADEDIVSIVDNLVEDVGQPGIAVAVNVTWGVDFSDIMISGNTVIRWARNNAYAPGIAVSSANALITGNYLDQENYNNGQGITNVDNPGWIINNTIRNCAGERFYDIEAGVINEHNY